MRTVDFWRPHYFIIGLAGVFLATTLAMICAWYNYQLNPDATSYMTIAQKYAHGDFRHALNGYWAPMFSWLLMPAVWLNISMIVAAKSILAFAGLGILILLYSFMYRKGVQKMLAGFICLAAALLMMPWIILESITPDLLMVLWTLLLVTLLDVFLDRPTRRMGIGLGVLGAVMYFTKGFGLFYFVGTLGAVALWQWRNEKQLQSVVKRYLPAAITLAVLVLPFIGAISHKYGHLTINNAGMYDHRIFGPVAMDAQPIEYAGPLIPPNSSAISAWEDPTPLAKMVPDWSILGSHAELKFFFQSVIGRNINRTLQAVGSFGPLIAFALLTIVLGCLQRGGKYRKEFALLALATGMMALGYLLVLTQARYLWATALLGLMSLGLWVTGTRTKQIFNNLQIVVLGIIICSAMLLTTLQNIFNYKYIDRQYYRVAMSLKQRLPQNAKIISDSYNQSYYDCFYLKTQCFSVVAPPAKDTQAYYSYLKSLGITHYIDYHTRDNDLALQTFVKTYFTRVDQRVVDQVPVTTYELR